MFPRNFFEGIWSEGEKRGPERNDTVPLCRTWGPCIFHKKDTRTTAKDGTAPHARKPGVGVPRRSAGSAHWGPRPRGPSLRSPPPLPPPRLPPPSPSPHPRACRSPSLARCSHTRLEAHTHAGLPGACGLRAGSAGRSRQDPRRHVVLHGNLRWAP